MARVNAAEDRYTFFTDWYDPTADLVKRFQLTYFLRDATIEMFDCKNKRNFLRRMEYPTLQLKDLFIGSTVTVYARQLKIVDYADKFTRDALESEKQRTLAMIKPDGYQKMGQILSKIQHETGLLITNLKLVKLTRQEAEDLYIDHKEKDFFGRLVQHVISDVVLAVELWGDHAVKTWREHVEKIRSTCTDATKNLVHGSDSEASAIRELAIFFGPQKALYTTALLNNCTLCLVRPHAITNLGEIVDRILSEGFEISAMSMYHLDTVQSEEFLEAYRGVLTEYHDMALHLSSGASVAIEVRQNDPVETFRKLCGPHDPEIGRHIRPNTIRAEYGVDRVRNAVHCTDLPEDGQLECEFFFKILPSSTIGGA